MKIFVTDQKHNFKKLLYVLAARPTSTFDKTRLKQKVSTIRLNIELRPNDLDLACLFRYKIFPPKIMTYMTQWDLEQRSMRVGDTIVQQIFIPPTRLFSQKLIVGVRINDIISEPHRRGFSYETIEGHVEKGESTFTVETHHEALVFKIQTYSQPGNLLTRLVGPICTVPYQAYCTQMALKHVKRRIESNTQKQTRA